MYNGGMKRETIGEGVMTGGTTGMGFVEVFDIGHSTTWTRVTCGRRAEPGDVMKIRWKVLIWGQHGRANMEKLLCINYDGQCFDITNEPMEWLTEEDYMDIVSRGNCVTKINDVWAVYINE